MSVARLSISGLKKILAGKVKEDATCVIKFYSNECHLCHNLKEYYEEISDIDGYNKIHFFAFNVDNYPAIEKQLSFNGVPTISLIKTYSTPSFTVWDLDFDFHTFGADSMEDVSCRVRI